MCRPGFGLKAPALAWKPLALAWRKPSRALVGRPRLGPAWLWPRPGLSDITCKSCDVMDTFWNNIDTVLLVICRTTYY
ncbi:hypothetical protein F5890DRAFT_1540352 [Lentinula detonsa]|uniref:Uncharacterized protein n=1 Tax=Lentinula detonsa TaxID=2804962 RepID=A0AA38PS70_9AGAR|nr:hypothetical protein F5890DRAFT_1540352 [Lentinula detonsa]